MNPIAFAAGRLLWRRPSRRAVASCPTCVVDCGSGGLSASGAQAAAPAASSVSSLQRSDRVNFRGLRQSKVSTFRMQLELDVGRAREADRWLPNTSGCNHKPYRWGRYDPIFVNAAKNGVRIMPVLLGSPSWAASKQQNPPMHRAIEPLSTTSPRRRPTATAQTSDFLERDRGLNGADVRAKYLAGLERAEPQELLEQRPEPSPVHGNGKGYVRGRQGAATRARRRSSPACLLGQQARLRQNILAEHVQGGPANLQVLNAAFQFIRTPRLRAIAVDYRVRPLRSMVR